MHNFTQKLLELLPLCTYSDILSNGSWTFISNRKTDSPWKMCPATKRGLLADEHLSHQYDAFSCLQQHYVKAHFETPGCNILQLKDSLHALHQHGSKVALVGDSLTAQQYLSLQCTSEQFHVPGFKDISYQVDMFLRGDIPCDPRCLTDPEFRHQKVDILRHPCLACLKQNPRSFVNYASSPKEWHHKLPVDTTALIIGSGAWYNSFKGIINSTATYAETLNVLGPLFQDLKKLRGIDTFWQGLPPHNINTTTTLNASFYGYEWIYYPEKDAVAKTILEPYGVTFIDIDRLTKARKAHNPSVAADGIHWCNPGLDAVPTFINRVIFHLLAMKKILGLETESKKILGVKK